MREYDSRCLSSESADGPGPGSKHLHRSYSTLDEEPRVANLDFPTSFGKVHTRLARTLFMNMGANGDVGDAVPLPPLW